MTTAEKFPSSQPTVGGLETGKWWVVALVGVAFVLMGLFVLGNLVLATIVSAIFFAAALAVGGIFQVFHAFSAKGWGGFLLDLLIGLLYIAAGVVLAMNPVVTSFALTLLFAAFLLASGIFRLTLAWRHWHVFGWLLVASGLIGIAAGIVILMSFPGAALWVLGLCLAVDLLVHGFWWLLFGFNLRAAQAA